MNRRRCWRTLAGLLLLSASVASALAQQADQDQTQQADQNHQ